MGYAKAMTTSSLEPLSEQAKATSHNLSLVVEEVITALDETDVLQFEQYSLVRASLFASHAVLGIRILAILFLHLLR